MAIAALITERKESLFRSSAGKIFLHSRFATWQRKILSRLYGATVQQNQNEVGNSDCCGCYSEQRCNEAQRANDYALYMITKDNDSTVPPQHTPHSCPPPFKHYYIIQAILPIITHFSYSMVTVGKI